MRKLVYSVATSLDGYVAGPKGESDWIVMDPEIDFAAIFVRFDTVLLGRKTFDAAQAQGHGGTMPGVRSVIVSRTLRAVDHPELTIIGDELGPAVSRLRAEPGKDIWLFGGGTLFRSLLDLELVDAIEVAVVPVLLGQGIPLLPARTQRSKLQLTNSKVYKATGIVSLEYAVVQAAP